MHHLNMWLTRLGLLFALCGLGAAELTLPSYYWDGMVFQADQNQTMMWGFTTDDTLPVLVTVRCDTKTDSEPVEAVLRAEPKDFKSTKSKADAFIWEVIYDEERANGDACIVIIEQGDSAVFLDDAVFGDVWFCSGQNNMHMGMQNIFNATEEVANSAGYTNIRMFTANMQDSSEEQDDLIEGARWDSWDTPDLASRLNPFSAVCFLFARSMTNRLSPAGEDKRVFGLIHSSWSGNSRIESFMSQDALDACNVEPNVESGDGSHNSNSYVWNAMVHPFLRHNIYGVLWYQGIINHIKHIGLEEVGSIDFIAGEANLNWNRDMYNCTFPQKIMDWRDKWHSNFVPYGFVQLANQLSASNGVFVRWHQGGKPIDNKIKFKFA